LLELGLITFAKPWLLLAAAALPILWLLLRVTPPAPKRLPFPAIRLLTGLKAREETPIKTPWWLVLLRTLALALLIFGLAQPVINPDERLYGSGPLIIVLDDGWAAAPRWSGRIAAADRLLAQAEREGRRAALVTTAPSALGGDAEPPILLPASEARQSVLGLEPKPWPVSRIGALRQIEALAFEGTAQIVWLSDGQRGNEDEQELADFAEALQQKGRLDVLDDGAAASARLVLPPENTGQGLLARVERASSGAPETLRLIGIGDEGEVLSNTHIVFEENENIASADLDLPAELRNRIAQLRIENEQGAGAVLLMDERWRRRPVGLITEASAAGVQPLLSGTYYLRKALNPFTELRTGPIRELLDRELAVLVLTDEAQVEDEAVLEDWMRRGGLLVRFAGPRLAENPRGLLPVALRGRDRVLGGALTWNAPVALGTFSPESPFHGLEVPADVVVRRQVLAEPALDLQQKTWAILEDGTPLVTADRVGDGWIVLFHVSANTDWSNLPLSGLFVQMLRRLLEVSQGVVSQDAGEVLQPLTTLNGFGVLTKASGLAEPVTADTLSEPGSVSAQRPPGYYGRDGLRRAHNLGGDLRALEGLPALPDGVVRRGYATSGELDIGPWLIALATGLLLADFLLALWLRGHLAREPMATTVSRTTASLVAAAVLSVSLSPPNALAQSGTDDERALEATLLTRIGYILTNVPEVDAASAAGLSGLTRVLHLRTSIEAGPPLPVEIEQDELAFFPLLYWPILPEQETLSPIAGEKLQSYLDNGGTVLFDLRDPTAGARITGQVSSAERSLRNLLEGVEIPPLIPLPPDHVLTKAFYLMQDFPGRFAGGTLWVEGSEGSDQDGVTSVVIGANDWASAWAVDRLGRTLYPVVPGGEQQRELAYRFGVNLVMYALTGNYKADQVHVPFILERLGQ
jgi:hypothetical protein